MFDFGKANEEQRKAISTVNGPVLIAAGPGTGKTYTLVQRTIYLIEECGLKPENILIATFTEKAAKELITRITDELSQRGINVNINKMYVGTFHSICLRILEEHLESTRFHRNYRLMDAFEQRYMVTQNINKFREISNYQSVIYAGSLWREAMKICDYAERLSEELITSDKLIKDSDPTIKALGEILKVYQDILTKENLMDFASIQVETYNLLKNHPEILAEIRSHITHLMVDEYQDTNYIQEQLVFLLAGDRKNICVVGDDDQGLYRFRGATIRNILEFPEKFAKDECKIISLLTNYRSNSDIIDFYNDWMQTTHGSRFKFEWGKYRIDKKIRAQEKSAIKSPAVVKLSVSKDPDGWHHKILEFINKLMNSGKLKDYNQIAFLFKSVKNQKVLDLANFLEQNRIHVYSPRSNMFFERSEIKLAIGCLILLFPKYEKEILEGTNPYLQERNRDYYHECMAKANSVLSRSRNKDLKEWIDQMAEKHDTLEGTTDYAYCGLLYQMFQFQPFSSILDTDMNSGVTSVRPIRNLARLTQIIGDFEYIYRINVLDAKTGNTDKKRIDENTEKLFNHYLTMLLDEGITEYEDDSEYAPSGCVSFLTIHQAKGLEFPIVFVDSLQSIPRKDSDALMDKIGERYLNRPAYEPADEIKYFDFWRLYYTAFSRAQDLLILTCNETSQSPSKYFRDTFKNLPSIESPMFYLPEFNFKPIKNVNLKKTYSFASDISVYDTCSRQYKFYKELGFMPVKTNATLFGTLVHETIEDIHDAIARNEENTITAENVEKWFDENYATLTQAKHTYLAKPQRESALKQVLRYVNRQHDHLTKIQPKEDDFTLVEPDYIIDGKINFIHGKNDTIEIVDYKSKAKPDSKNLDDNLKDDQKKMNLYAYLVEKQTGHKVSKMHLYYTAEDKDNPTITYPYQEKNIKPTLTALDDTVHKIMNRDYQNVAEEKQTCDSCDFRYYCTKKKQLKSSQSN